ncbi:hypothetical protein BDV23DRAFT_177252 [Aspergillus alliaceus]|uniref:Uncharacterized protein n=1 Tax=Petromyces alliaceus TaxID=209559 RepID=A0A5N7BQR6_PETAA|nr:hypothetical protein BDV23DRAFT_177252 [Aspergillus alliaceus]
MDGLIHCHYNTTSFSQGQRDAISAGWQQFYTANDRSAQIHCAWITDMIIPLFTTANALVERWPTTSFLAFLTFHWHDYGSDGALETMGLRLPWRLKDRIDTIHDYMESGPVLIQTEVLDNQPRWQVAQLQDTLDFSQKLEAIDYYARVLVLEYVFSRWLGDASPRAMSPAQKRQVVEALDKIACIWYIQSILVQWLTVQTMGPMSTVVKRYQVKAEIHENYTVKPLVAECYPALVTTKTTIKKANQAAHEYLQEELGPKHLARK